MSAARAIAAGKVVQSRSRRRVGTTVPWSSIVKKALPRSLTFGCGRDSTQRSLSRCDEGSPGRARSSDRAGRLPGTSNIERGRSLSSIPKFCGVTPRVTSSGTTNLCEIRSGHAPASMSDAPRSTSGPPSGLAFCALAPWHQLSGNPPLHRDSCQPCSDAAGRKIFQLSVPVRASCGRASSCSSRRTALIDAAMGFGRGRQRRCWSAKLPPRQILEPCPQLPMIRPDGRRGNIWRAIGPPGKQNC